MIRLHFIVDMMPCAMLWRAKWWCSIPLSPVWCLGKPAPSPPVRSPTLSLSCLSKRLFHFHRLSLTGSSLGSVCVLTKSKFQ